MKRAFVWSGIATLAFALLQIHGLRSQGHDGSIVFREAHFGLVVWPGFFVTILVFTSGFGKDVQKRAYLAGERLVENRRPAPRGGNLPTVSCPGCGAANPRIALACHRCGITLREIEVVHPLETLAGAKHSAPSLLYLIGAVASGGCGALTLYAIGEERFLESTGLMIGGFMGGMAVSLTLFFFLISRWAEKKYGR